jgi:hypothetical protein
MIADGVLFEGKCEMIKPYDSSGEIDPGKTEAAS